MRIKMQKSKRETEEYVIENDHLFSMTEQEIDILIDHITTLDDLKEIMKRTIKLARYKNGNSRA
jgi:Na+/phosphate symporter